MKPIFVIYNKWKNIFDNSPNKLKTYQTRKYELFSDLEILADNATTLFYEERRKNLINIDEIENQKEER